MYAILPISIIVGSATLVSLAVWLYKRQWPRDATDLTDRAQPANSDHINSRPAAINLMDTLYVAIQLAEAGERPTGVIEFLTKEFESRGKIFDAYFWHNKQPASQTESLAVYGLAAQLCYLVNETKLAKALIYRVVCLQKFDEKPLFAGIHRVFREPLHATHMTDYVVVLHGSNRKDCPFSFVEKQVLRHFNTSG